MVHMRFVRGAVDYKKQRKVSQIPRKESYEPRRVRCENKAWKKGDNYEGSRGAESVSCLQICNGNGV